MPQSKTSIHRQWQDLRKWRLVGALMLAACVLWVFIVVAGGLADFPLPGFGLLAALIVSEVWFLVLGLAYLFAFARRRRTLSRRDCLVLGTWLIGLFPAFVVAISYAIVPNPRNIASLVEWFVVGELLAAAVGVLMIPFGLLAGWFFWRFGVRPAPLPEPDASGVFD
jgi:hypothetical protein